MSATNKPLAGKRIVVTRAPEQSAEFGAQLEALGAEVLFLPTIKFTDPEDLAALDRAVAGMDKFDWVIFTSRNSVKFVAKRLDVLSLSPKLTRRPILKPEVAVIGSATRDEALAAGFIPSYNTEESRGDALASELADRVKGKRILLPHSSLGDPVLVQRLLDAGADVMEVIAYRTIQPGSFDPKILQMIRERGVDVITFFSPSAYRHLVGELDLAMLCGKSSKMLIATIGPTTSSAVRNDGLEVAIEAPSASAAALCQAIASYFRDRTREGAPVQ